MSDDTDGQEKDKQLVRQLEATVSALQAKYYAASQDDQWDLIGPLNDATAKLIKAREALLRSGMQSTEEMFTRLAAIKQQMDDAADTQQLIVAAGRLVGFLARLV
jgi:hypothetical protein